MGPCSVPGSNRHSLVEGQVSCPFLQRSLCFVRRPGFEPGTVSLEGNRAVLLRQRRWVPRLGVEPKTPGVKARYSVQLS